ncbi:hypothetical protein Ocin01_03932 [Orchesella cincta]|uniref:Uncharacterized protein n=1 Tax=Orchesella cincta TaxID=48709 RepID=A0A1D2NBZ9_ORCCI|nr:hypothetical protein Ocin01_03932 [Orchesella cincta]
MVDIAIEILASSTLIRNGYKARYRIKSWWAHVDVPPEITFIKMPRLPLIQPYLGLNGRETIAFVEVWEDNTYPDKDRKFLGMSTCHIDKQLKDPNLNPAVEWLDVYDPIEGVKRGKLLLKIDAKFIDNGNKDDDAPVKIPQSRLNYDQLSPRFQESNESPTKHSVCSRKSETSAFSVGSAISVRSFDQGIQTDLSVPMLLPDISRYTAALRSYSNSDEISRYSPKERHLPRQTSQSCSEASSVIVDPLQVAERLLLKGGASKPRDKTGQNSPRTSTTAFRRNCLVKQNLVEQEQRSPSQNNEIQSRRRGNSKEYNLESVDDVIDLLRNGVDSVFISSPTPNSLNSEQKGIGCERRGSASEYNAKPIAKPRNISPSAKPPLPVYTRHDGNNNNNNDNKGKPVDLVRITAPQSMYNLERNRILSGNASRDVGHHHQQNFELLNTNNQIEDNSEQSRFREVHYDGEKAKEQATIMLKTKTAQPTTQSVANPPITRRRIAAAIFND